MQEFSTHHLGQQAIAVPSQVGVAVLGVGGGGGEHNRFGATIGGRWEGRRHVDGGKGASQAVTEDSQHARNKSRQCSPKVIPHPECQVVAEPGHPVQGWPFGAKREGTIWGGLLQAM